MTSHQTVVAPLTAADIVDAKLDQLQTRLGYLWEIAHSPLVVQAPVVASLYMRQLRSLAFHHDVTISTPQTQLNYCSNCCQINLPSLNSTIQIRPSQERIKRERKRNKYKAVMKKKNEEEKTSADATSAMSDIESDAVLTTPRKRKRSLSPSTPLSSFSPSPSPTSTAALSTAGASSMKAHSSHEIISRCHTCRHIDRVRGMTTRHKKLLHESNTNLEELVAGQTKDAMVEEQVNVQEVAAKKQRLLQSLQSQTSVAAPASLKPTLASLQQLSQAQQRFQQSKQSLAGQSSAAIATPPAAQTNSFFQEQFKNAAGVASPSPPPSSTATKPFTFSATRSSPTLPLSAPASSSTAAPFTFSRSSVPSSSAPKFGGSLYSLLQSSTPGTATTTSSTPKPKPVPSTTTAPATSMIQGIQIVSGIKSATTNSKTFTVTAKGGGKMKNNNKR